MWNWVCDVGTVGLDDLGSFSKSHRLVFSLAMIDGGHWFGYVPKPAPTYGHIHSHRKLVYFNIIILKRWDFIAVWRGTNNNNPPAATPRDFDVWGAAKLDRQRQLDGVLQKTTTWPRCYPKKSLVSRENAMICPEQWRHRGRRMVETSEWSILGVGLGWWLYWMLFWVSCCGDITWRPKIRHDTFHHGFSHSFVWP